MTTLYDYGTELADTVEQVQDLLSEGVDPNDEIVQELLEKMVAQEEDWEVHGDIRHLEIQGWCSNRWC